LPIVCNTDSWPNLSVGILSWQGIPALQQQSKPHTAATNVRQIEVASRFLTLTSILKKRL